MRAFSACAMESWYQRNPRGPVLERPQFSRNTKVDAFGTGAPYLFLPAHYVSHTGDRPIALTWRLAYPMPTDVFTTASVAAGRPCG
jgi:hypothetical protein